MTKKLLTCGIITVILFFCTGICFASEENSANKDNRNLGSELSDSMKKIENKAGDIKNGWEKDMNTVDGAITDNKMTNDYNATRTNLETETSQFTGMTDTTWIWIILAVVGIIILATVWFYAMQNTGND